MEKLVNNRFVDQLEKCGLFSDFQCGFRFFRSTSDLLTVIFAFNRSGATWAVALDIPVALDRFWHTGLFHKLKSYGISGQIFGLISSLIFIFDFTSVINSFGWFWMRNHDKNIQLEVEFLKGLFLVLHISFYIFMTFLMVLSIILLSMLMILLFTKCNQASDLWKLNWLRLAGLITLVVLM